MVPKAGLNVQVSSTRYHTEMVPQWIGPGRLSEDCTSAPSMAQVLGRSFRDSLHGEKMLGEKVLSAR